VLRVPPGGRYDPIVPPYVTAFGPGELHQVCI